MHPTTLTDIEEVLHSCRRSASNGSPAFIPACVCAGLAISYCVLAAVDVWLPAVAVGVSLTGALALLLEGFKPCDDRLPDNVLHQLVTHGLRGLPEFGKLQNLVRNQGYLTIAQVEEALRGPSPLRTPRATLEGPGVLAMLD